MGIIDQAMFCAKGHFWMKNVVSLLHHYMWLCLTNSNTELCGLQKLIMLSFLGDTGWKLKITLNLGWTGYVEKKMERTYEVRRARFV